MSTPAQPEWAYGADFQGTSTVIPGPDTYSGVTLEFRISRDIQGLPEGTTDLTPLMVAESLNSLLVDNGWPPAQFWGTPVDAKLNELPS
ncbi:hypothetical protein E6R60_26840 [Streptomyces sp. A0642]|uniref:hypothetical protein n=1 Tax=Streptomyces sp. A0642 TaxID=2563100 RepID=UPI0010A26656|nr:hypothetical protein [Streptomyces sp. A0642]THA72548.1 hypothetical protein E6R60_26840 [Streptomyces sp. A0642]